MAEEKKELILSDGKIAKVGEFKGKHVLQAQKVAGKDTDKMIFALIATCVTVDDKKIVMEDLEEMNGGDVLNLMGEFSGNF